VDDLRGYKVEVSDAMRADAMGYSFLGMPPPSSGTVGMAMVRSVLLLLELILASSSFVQRQQRFLTCNRCRC
jgi:gamma-glutamyltranspeptidase